MFNFVLSGREELLTEHAIFWNRKKIEGLPRSLAKRYTKVSELLHFLVKLFLNALDVPFLRTSKI